MPDSLKRLEKLKSVFENLFSIEENTLLQYGAEEPFYRAPESGNKAIIFSREDYFSSALHEIAHWCIAGEERRKLDDFGYWYKPEGRNQAEQTEFEKVEIKPQAIEWALSLACGETFHFSADNLTQGIDASDSFKHNVTAQLKAYLENGLPTRAQKLFDGLKKEFCNEPNLGEIFINHQEVELHV